MDGRPEDDRANCANEVHEVGRIEDKSRDVNLMTGSNLGDFVGEVLPCLRELGANEIEEPEERAADDGEGEEAHAEDTADVAKQGLAVFKEDAGTFAASLGGAHVFAVHDPA